MGKLSMKNFGANSDGNSNSFDFGGLEVNPRFNQDNTEENKEGDSDSDGDKGNGDELEGTREPDEVTNTEDSNTDLLNTNATLDQQVNVDSNAVQPVITDEAIFKNLSERLGREVRSLEDLSTKQDVEELDPQVKAINDWKIKTGRPIEDFFKYQKDYSQVSDLEVAREVLRLEYPTFSDSDLDIELENFKVSEEDLESEAKKKSHELKKYATKGRKILEGLKTDLGQPSTASYTQEIKSKIEFAEQVQNQMEANKKEQEKYSEGITKASLSTTGFKMNLAEDLSLDFKLSEQDKKSIPALISEMPHWRTETGEWNHNAVVQDAIKIKHFDAMIKLAYEQGLNSGKEDLLKKAKNSTLGSPTSNEQGVQTRRPSIEGIDKILGGQKLTMKFGGK